MNEFQPMYQPQPTDEELKSAPLIHAMLQTSEGLGPDDPLWKKVVDIGNGEFEEWYREAVQKAVASYGIDPSLVEVKRVDRPPRVSPLIPDFFVNIAASVTVILATPKVQALWDGFRGGNRSIQEDLTHKLVEEGIPPETLRLRFSPAELEEMAKDYVRQKGHPRAELTTTRELFNTVISGGYPRRIDATKPSGWEITVSTSRVTFTFIVDSAAAVLQATRQEGQECLELAITSLLEDEI